MAQSRGQIGLLVVASSVLWFAVGCIGTLLWVNRQPLAVEDGSEITDSLETLGLTDEQRLEVAEIVSRYRQRVVRLHQQVDQARTSFWSEVRLAELDADTDIAQVLTEAQRQAYEEMARGET